MHVMTRHIFVCGVLCAKVVGATSSYGNYFA